MTKDHGPSVKDDKLYEELREQGESKEKAARIANARAAGARHVCFSHDQVAIEVDGERVEY